MTELKIGGMPGMPITILGASAARAAGTAGPANAAQTTSAATIVLRTILPSLAFYLAFEFEFSFACLAHQRRPDSLPQFRETRQAQRFARARPRQVDSDVLVNP